MKHRALLILVTFVFAMAMVSCHSSRKTVRGSQGRVSVETGHTRGSVDADVAASLVVCARQWIGTPYKYGGLTRRGVDCSGLTYNVFESAAGITLPRDSRSQNQYCRSISRGELQPGDLVFFVNTPGGKRINHVGLYIGDGRMIHASSSRGVMESPITTGYWADHYFCSGRVEAVTYAARGKKPGKNQQRPEVSRDEPLLAETPARPEPIAEIVVPRQPLPEPVQYVDTVATTFVDATPTAPADTVYSSWLDCQY